MKTLNEQLNKMKYLSNYKKGSPLNEQFPFGFDPKDLGSKPDKLADMIEKAYKALKKKAKEIPSGDEIIDKLAELFKYAQTDAGKSTGWFDTVKGGLESAFSNISDMVSKAVNEQDEDKSEKVLSDLDKILNTIKNSTVQKESFVIKRNGKTIRLSESDMKKITKKHLKEDEFIDDEFIGDEFIDDMDITDTILNSVGDFEL